MPLATQEADLVSASRDNDIDEVAKLIEEGVNLNAKDNYQWTALMYVVKNGHSVVKLLLLAQCDLHPLHAANEFISFPGDLLISDNGRK